MARKPPSLPATVTPDDPVQSERFLLLVQERPMTAPARKFARAIDAIARAAARTKTQSLAAHQASRRRKPEPEAD